MSSDSDSDDDAKMAQFLEATDITFLNNSMFQSKENVLEKETTNALCNDMKEFKNDMPKSQRYIIEDTENTGADFHLPESMQKYLAKKFSEISEKYYEFYTTPKSNLSKVKTKYKNRLKLLRESDCFVNPYEDFEYDNKGPTKKPVIKRRIVGDEAVSHVTEDSLKAIAIDANYILSGQEVKAWAKKKERKDKVFYYKMASTGVLHAKDETNEFSEIRHKNKWNENKIKNFTKI